MATSALNPAATGVASGAVKKMTLYDYPLAFNPAKARLVFAEKGIPHETKLVNLFSGENLRPEYLRINPAGSAPTLVDGPKVITESREVLEYVDAYDAKPLGGTAVDRAFVADWLQQVDAFDGNLFIAAQGPDIVNKLLLTPLNEYSQRFAEARMKQNPDLRDVYTKKLAALKKSQEQIKDRAVVSKNRSQLVELLDRAEQRLASNTYLAGNSYSLADVIFTPVLYRIGQVGKTDEFLQPRPKLRRYYGLLQSRPSFNKVFGPQQNPLFAGSLVLPALARVVAARLFNWY